MRDLLKKLGAFLLHRYVLRAVGIFIFGAILWFIDLSTVWKILRTADKIDVIFGVLLFFPLAFTKALRWNLIKQGLGILVSPSQSFFYQLIGQMAFFTPGRIGDFIKALYLKAKDYSLGKSIISIIGDRLFDVVTMVIVGVGGFAYFFNETIRENFIAVAMGSILLLGVLLIGIKYRAGIKNLLKGILKFFVPGQFKPRVDTLLSDLKNHVVTYSIKQIFVLFFISIVGFSLQVLKVYFFARSIGISVSFFPLAGIIALMSLSNLLPISFVGLGTRDAVFLYFFGLLGVAPAKSIGLSIMVFGSIVFIASFSTILFTFVPPGIEVSSVLNENE
jgi:uncharacterized protein (TIRG00374 family)